MKTLSIVIAWTGCLLPYLASSRQCLWPVRPPRGWAWTGFALLQLGALLLLAQLYPLLSAAIMTLAIVMCAWITQVIGAPYFQRHPLVFVFGGGLVYALFMVVG